MKTLKKRYFFAILCIFAICSFAFISIQARTQTTILGYKLGKLKKKEAKLLKKKQLLTAKLAKASTRKNLLQKLNH
jgi:hypothetical protein